MRSLFLSLAFWMFVGAPAAAQSRHDCAPSQITIINKSISSAKSMTFNAATASDVHVHFERWFGTYTEGSAARVRGNFKGILKTIRSGVISVQCHMKTDSGCQAGEFAFVYVLEPYEIHLCPSFFGLPAVTNLRPGDTRSENGTRGGTIIHELSHFRSAAGTEDHCYARSVCADMAKDSPRRAVDNADSYQYFAEDITHFGHQ